MTKIGYARVSTEEQNLDLQLDALKHYGCQKIFTDKISGSQFERKGFDELLSYVREGDTIVIWRLDRLGRSLKDLIDIVNMFKIKGLNFKVLQGAIDTTTPEGTLFFHMTASFAEYERSIIRYRTKVGLEAARARGRFGERPKGLSKDTLNKSLAALTLYNKQELTTKQIATQLGIGVTTLYRYLKYHGVNSK